MSTEKPKLYLQTQTDSFQYSSENHIIPIHEQNPKVLAEGRWAEGVSWQFETGLDHPEHSLCTSVFGVVSYRSKLVLVKHVSRGWELPGGHIEPGEDPLLGLKRELIEEAGFIFDDQDSAYFGHKKVTMAKPIPHRSGKGSYPFPDSYLPYYVVAANEHLAINLADDIAEIALVGFDQAQRLIAASVREVGVDHSHDLIIRYCLTQKLIEVLT